MNSIYNVGQTLEQCAWVQIDIEGNEWPVLEGMIKDKAPFMFTQMQVPPPASLKSYVKNGIGCSTPPPGPPQVAPAWLCAGTLTTCMWLIKLYDLSAPGVCTACIASHTTNPLLF
jgi:hypothetical protein